MLNIDELGLFFLRHCHRKDLQKREGKEEVENKIKSDALSHCLYLLMVSRFVTLLLYGDPRSLVALKNKKTSIAYMESIISPMLKLG